MSIAVYIRVSTHSQKSDSQKAEISRWLKAHGHDLSEVMWYEDHESGTTMNRKEFNLLTEVVFAGTVKTIIVCGVEAGSVSAIHERRDQCTVFTV